MKKTTARFWAKKMFQAANASVNREIVLYKSQNGRYFLRKEKDNVCKDITKPDPPTKGRIIKRLKTRADDYAIIDLTIEKFANALIRAEQMAID